MSDTLSKIFKVVELICLVALIAWVANNLVKGCNSTTIKPPITVATARLDSIATQIDSLRDANTALLSKNQELAQWVVFYKNQQPKIVTADKTITIYDTIYSIQKMRDTIEKDVLVTGLNAFDDKLYLKLPHAFDLKDDYLKVTGRLDTDYIHIDTVGVFNQIVLRDNVTRTFWRESHSIMFQNTNPYITNVTPAYIYTRPTKRGEIIKRIGWFTAGLGLGYGVSYLKK